ncbi:MAG: DUF177 domain-containing protein [Proteobacteria bacterium]|nr:DUF177 domain-containing protein [Pseudomonadota bacterium]
MFIRLSEIEDGAVLKGKIDGSQLKGTIENEFSFLAPVDYELVVRKFENNVRLEGSIGCSLSLMCGRCTDVFPFIIQTFLDVGLQKKISVPDTELELAEEDLEVYYYEGDEIDINPLIYEEVLLSIPIKPLCREDCRGLCPVCGKNNNIEECHCNKVANKLLEEKLNAFLARQGDNYGSSKKKNFSVKKGQTKNTL